MYDLNCLLRYLLSKSKKHTASILLAGTKEGTKTVPLEPFCNFRMQQISYLEELSQPRKCQRKHKLSCSFMCLTNINQPNIAIQQMLPSMLERYCVFHWPTNAFFATVNQMFGGSFDLPATAILNDCAQRFDYCPTFDWQQRQKTQLSVEVWIY